MFNRSHYEDVLVPVVDREPEKQWHALRADQRLRALLTEHGTVVCKLMLHISKDEQRERLQARLDDPRNTGSSMSATSTCASGGTNTWHAYDAAIRATGTPWAPWTVVPAD